MDHLNKTPINIDTYSHAQIISWMKTSNSTEKISLLDFILQKYSTNVYAENRTFRYNLPNSKHKKLLKLLFEYGCDYYSTNYVYHNLANYRVVNVHIADYINTIKNKPSLSIAFGSNNLDALKHICKNSDKSTLNLIHENRLHLDGLNIFHENRLHLDGLNLYHGKKLNISKDEERYKIIINVLKPWSIFNHDLFPNKFRIMVKSILIINNRLWNSNTRYFYFLPDELWHVIFSYSDRLNFNLL